MRASRILSALASIALAVGAVAVAGTPASAVASITMNPSTFAGSTLISSSFTATISGINLNTATKFNAGISGWTVPNTCTNTPNGTISNCGISSVTIDSGSGPVAATVQTAVVPGPNNIMFLNSGTAWTATSATIEITFAANAFTTPAAGINDIAFQVSSSNSNPIDAASVVVIPAVNPYPSCTSTGSGMALLVTYANDGGANVCAVTKFLGPFQSVPANSYTRAGYDFTGWNTAADGSGTNYSVGRPIMLSMGSGTLLYAQWAPSANGSSGGSGTTTSGSSTSLASTGSFADALLPIGFGLIVFGGTVAYIRRRSA